MNNMRSSSDNFREEYKKFNNVLLTSTSMNSQGNLERY